ncbi:MAG: RpiB/LacA/LacB family sugar-phosphate isomerase [Bacilli bacterium]|nr:RpiB/LacA/LacB family sugar-phosphate isomerase [Bacilli bacterium]
MKIGIASDHRGVKRKTEIINFLNIKGFECIDYGTDSIDSVDYPLFAFKLCEDMDNIDLGILICGTGIGMSIAANKVKGIRCAKVDTKNDAYCARYHNNANVIALSAEDSLFKMKGLVSKFLSTKFSNEERHIRRINMIDEYDNKL